MPGRAKSLKRYSMISRCGPALKLRLLRTSSSAMDMALMAYGSNAPPLKQRRAIAIGFPFLLSTYFELGADLQK
jgi:hypothetical protein